MINLFGSEKEFATLTCINNLYLTLNRNEQKYVSRLLSELNRLIVKSKTIEDKEILMYFIKAVRDEFTNRSDVFFNRIKILDEYKENNDDLMIFNSHVKNFIVAKTRKVMEK